MTTAPRADDGAGALAGRVAVVSGGGRGLGRSFCLALARQGAKVVVNNRNRVVDADGRGQANQVADQITAAGGEAVAEYSDAADPGSGQAMVAAARRHWGRLDICVANAAIGAGGMFHRQAAEQFDEVLAINLQGSIRLAVAAPVYMTNMLVRHTGKRLLEKHMARSKGAAYANYVGRTSGFIPWPPR